MGWVKRRTDVWRRVDHDHPNLLLHDGISAQIVVVPSQVIASKQTTVTEAGPISTLRL